MTRLSVVPVSKEGFAISATQGTTAIQVKFAGNGDMDATPVLGSYLKQLHVDACDLGVEEVVFDFSELYFMNSSCFKCFVSWIGQITKMEPSSRYLVRFQSNPQLHWQRRSLEAIRAFSPEVVEVEIRAR
jgi:hypothetical protein